MTHTTTQVEQVTNLIAGWLDAENQAATASDAILNPSEQHQRYQEKMALYATADDYKADGAAVLSRALLLAADGFRLECLLRAANRASYDQLRRTNQGTSLVLGEVVAATLQEFDERRLGQGDCWRPFRQWHADANDRLLAHKQTAMGQEAQSLPETHTQVLAAREVQRLGVAMAVSHTMMLAALAGGDLSQVRPLSVGNLPQLVEREVVEADIAWV